MLSDRCIEHATGKCNFTCANGYKKTIDILECKKDGTWNHHINTVCQSKKYIYTTPPKKKTHKKTTAIITFYSAVVLFEQSHFGFIPPQGVIRQVPLVEQELPTRPEHLGSPPVFSGVFVTQSLVFCVICFVDRCLSC